MQLSTCKVYVDICGEGYRKVMRALCDSKLCIIVINMYLARNKVNDALALFYLYLGKPDLTAKLPFLFIQCVSEQASEKCSWTIVSTALTFGVESCKLLVMKYITTL